ncbi:hypothetical protein D9611_000627 [Ephemerocybe angulata]|uniref:F-box domain-containing protein n=1 Tax=Ephemerocybe angulata TaxID=980116 RepID=A0A8H5F6T0_9AGAR|nr:hypothetical protein D9611_000627 [Tulosesus angulatus]
MSTSPESQQALDLEIAKLEQDLITLKRRRNGLSPISQLPTELMSRIFHLSLQFPEAKGWDRASIRHEDTRRSITHVSHGWRTVALEWPNFWSKIHIRDATKVDYLDLVRKRAKDLPLSIEFYGGSAGYLNGTVGTPGVCHIFQVEAERLTSVVLYAPIKILRSLLPKLTACCNTLQFLALAAPHTVGRNPVNPTQMDTFCNFPRLRRLDITGWSTLFISPTSFNPTSLTTMEVSFFCVPAAHVTHAFFASLRIVAHHLTTLTLAFILPNPLESESLGIAGTPPIDMPRLKFIILQSNGQGILPALSSVIRIPSFIRDVHIVARQGASSQDISLTLQDACTNIPSPDLLRIDKKVFPRDGTYNIDVDAFKREGPLNSPWRAHSVFRLSFFPPPITERPSMAVEPYTFPVPLVTPTNWLFSALRYLDLTFPFPVPFWKALALVPTLKAIKYCVTHPDDAFFQTLEEAIEADQVGTDDGKFFPSLLNLFPTFQQTGLSWDVEYAERLAILLLHKYQGKGSPYFECLDFAGCSRHLDADTLRLLFSVSKTVCWNEMRLRFDCTARVC